MKNKFIVIEGIECSGKTIIHEHVINIFREYGIDEIISTREPGSTPLGEQLRILIKEGIKEENITCKAELLMLYAARIQLVETVIKPALTRGAWVISDRYDLSSQAYQGGGRKLNHDFINTLRNLVLCGFNPDLTVYLDVTPEISLERMIKRGILDRIEQESLLFFTRTRNRYLELTEKDPTIIVIDATKSIEKVIKLVKIKIFNWLLKQQ